MGAVDAPAVSATPTAAAAGLAACEACGLVSRPAPPPAHSRCPRCRAHLWGRRPASQWRCGLYLVAAYALYVPANALPVMYTEQFFNQRADTILSGVLLLWATGAWPLAAIVFVASILVPLAKLLALTHLLLGVELGSRWSRRRRTRLYRVVRTVGRWSMLDIFVAAVLAAAVRIESIASVRPGPGALAFAAVVVLTMLASQAFDPRRIWDTPETGHGGT